MHYIYLMLFEVSPTFEGIYEPFLQRRFVFTSRYVLQSIFLRGQRSSVFFHPRLFGQNVVHHNRLDS